VRVWRGPSQPCVTEEDGEDEGGGGTCGGWLWLTALTGPMTGGSDGLLETRHIGYTLLRDISQYTPVLSLAANPNPMPKRGGGRRGASSRWSPASVILVRVADLDHLARAIGAAHGVETWHCKCRALVCSATGATDMCAE